MRTRRLTRTSLLAVLAIVALTTPVAAGDFRATDNANVGEGETVDDDLYVGAGMVTIAGTVNGDATIGAGTVSVSGTINGSLNVAGGTVDVLGDVTGAVRVAGGTVRIAGTVGRDVVIVGGNASIEGDAEVGGDVAGAGGSITILGTVAGDLLAGAGVIQLLGSVDGSVDVSVQNFSIGEGAVVGGDVTYTSAAEAQIADGAEIGGDVVRREPEDGSAGPAIAENPIVSYFGLLLGMLLLGFGLLWIRPRLVAGSAHALRSSPLPTLAIGVGVWIGQFVLVVLLFLLAAIIAALAGSIGGAFAGAAVVVILLIVLLLLLASVPVAMAIGLLVLPGDRSSYLRFLVGAAILSLILVLAGFLPVLGGILFLLVWILGLGAFFLYAWRTRREPMVLVTPTSPTAPPPAAAPPTSPALPPV